MVLRASSLLLLLRLGILTGQVPEYSADSIVNAATNRVGDFAPNTIATLYGKNLSYSTRANGSDPHADTLPTLVPNTGVRVTIDGQLAPLYYVSPGQVNFLIPANAAAHDTEIQLVRDAQAGPVVRIPVYSASPGLFATAAGLALGTHADGSVIGPDNPASQDEVIVLYGTGFGQTVPPCGFGEIARAAAVINQNATALVLIGGAQLDAANVLYIGVTPGFAGLYQLNVRIPHGTAPDAEIQTEVAGRRSPAGIRLTVKPLLQ